MKRQAGQEGKTAQATQKVLSRFQKRQDTAVSVKQFNF